MRWSFDGLVPFAWAAGVLTVVGVLMVLLEIQSPSFVQWHGIKARGDTYGGVTTYTYDGIDYSIDNPRVPAYSTKHIPTTVWLPYDDPTNTERAYIENPYNRWTDFAFVVGPFIVAFLVLASGVVRLTVRRRRYDQRALTSEFGTGISPDFVARVLADRERRASRDA